MSSNAFEQQVRDDNAAEDRRAQARAEQYRDVIARRDALMKTAARAVTEMRMNAASMRAAGYVSGAALALETAAALSRALESFRRDADYDTARKLNEFGGRL